MSTRAMQDQRSSRRVDLRVPAKIVTPSGEHRARTRNVSQGGVFFDSSHPLIEGTIVEATMILPAEFTGSARSWARCKLQIIRVDRVACHFGVAAKIVEMYLEHDPKFPQMERRVGERRSHERRVTPRNTRDRRMGDRRENGIVIDLDLPQAEDELIN